VQGKVTAKFVDSGEHSLKNIARPLRVYRVEFGGESTTRPTAPASSSPDKPSIAVLPFENMSDAADDYFADGIAEDIITELSRYPDLFVVARNSSFNTEARRRASPMWHGNLAPATCSKAVCGAQATGFGSMPN